MIPPTSVTAADLRSLAHDMPYRSEATKAELWTWLRRYAPDRLTALTPATPHGEHPTSA